MSLEAVQQMSTFRVDLRVYSSAYSRCQWGYVAFCCKMCCKLYMPEPQK